MGRRYGRPITLVSPGGGRIECRPVGAGGTHRYRNFAGVPAVGSAGTDADTATSDWDYGNGNLAATPASGNAGSGLATTTGSRSQRLDYDGVFFL